jgi:hypothetical protein
MNLILKRVLLTLGLLVMIAGLAAAQSPVQFKVYASDGTKTDSLVVAVNPLGTNAPGDSISPTLFEKELPPSPPSGIFDLRFIARDGGSGYGQGLKTDIRQTVSFSQADTFRIKFRSSSPEGSAMTISWPAGLNAVGSGGWKLVDIFGVSVVDINMTGQTSYVVSFAGYVPQAFTELYLIQYDGTAFRTFRSSQVALAVDGKGKPKAIKKKPVTVDFDFNIVAPDSSLGTVSSVKVKLGMLSTGIMLQGVDTVATFTGVKEFTYAAPIPGGTTFRVIGQGTKGKAIKAAGTWFASLLTKSKKYNFKVLAYNENEPNLPFPNLWNWVADLYASGVSVTVGQAAPKQVIHPKSGDILKSLNKKGVLHTGTPKCLDSYANGKAIAKGPVKALPPDKHNNLLLAAQIALKLNVASSDKGNTPAGYGDLVLADANGNFNGKTVRQLMDLADQVLSCVASPVTPAEMYDVVSYLDSAFSTSPLDTVSWATGVVWDAQTILASTGGRLTRTTSALPVTRPGDLKAASEIPAAFQLMQNYPNPFNPATTIDFSIPADGFVTLKVYNMLGQEVATLADREEFLEGMNSVEFDASALATGAYYYRLTVDGGGFTAIKKMMLIK